MYRRHVVGDRLPADSPANLPKDKLLACGNVCLEQRQLDLALEAFKTAASVELALST
jgi:hypothetical protein